MGLHNYDKPEKYTVETIIKNIGKDFAILETSGGIEFKWPLDKMPANKKIGDKVKVKIVSQEQEEAQKYEQMRSLLNEIVD